MKLNPLYHVIEGYRLACLPARALPTIDYCLPGGLFHGDSRRGRPIFRKLKPEFAEVM